VKLALLAALAVLAVAACDNGGTTPDWSRMITQPKILPFGETPMRQPPAGTIARDWQPQTTTAETTTIPVPITRELLDRGRQRFAIACSPCHGVRGDGDSAVAHAMQRRRPPSFADPKLVALTPGKMFDVVTHGYGFMPSYAGLLEVHDRWAVIAFVRTLQLADGARLARQR
jgi:mono/diheme cytochrome c family protein